MAAGVPTVRRILLTLLLLPVIAAINHPSWDSDSQSPGSVYSWQRPLPKRKHNQNHGERVTQTLMRVKVLSEEEEKKENDLRWKNQDAINANEGLYMKWDQKRVGEMNALKHTQFKRQRRRKQTLGHKIRHDHRKKATQRHKHKGHKHNKKPLVHNTPKDTPVQNPRMLEQIPKRNITWQESDKQIVPQIPQLPHQQYKPRQDKEMLFSNEQKAKSQMHDAKENNTKGIESTTEQVTTEVTEKPFKTDDNTSPTAPDTTTRGQPATRQSREESLKHFEAYLEAFRRHHY